MKKKMYLILRFQKHHGMPTGWLESHHERLKDFYASNPDIDASKREKDFHIIWPEETYEATSKKIIMAAGCRVRKNSIRFVDTLVTASPEFFNEKTEKEIRSFFENAVAFFEKKIGRENIITAVVHMDETTPHLHLVFVPITKDKRLSARDILGGRTGLSAWQDDIYDHMSSFFPELERGESAVMTGRKHIPIHVLKQMTSMEDQGRQLEKVFESITFLNTQKKKEEAKEMFEVWFENTRKICENMKRIELENETLRIENERIKGEKRKTLEAQIRMAELKKEKEDMQKLLANIPTDVLKMAEKKMNNVDMQKLV